MSDYSEQGAVPVDDAAVDDPPSVDEVRERQQVEHPGQAKSAVFGSPPTDEELATAEAGGEVIGGESGGRLNIEGPNSA